MNPDDFIPLAERTGYINNLTLWVLEKAIHQCRIWCDSGYDIRIAVNLSTENLMSDDLVKQIPLLVEKYNIDHSMLILEITESAMMKDPDKVIKVTHSLAQLGYHFSMDDFGTGYSSLEYIKRLPISELKIDKAFVQHIDKNKKDYFIGLCNDNCGDILCKYLGDGKFFVKGLNEYNFKNFEAMAAGCVVVAERQVEDNSILGFKDMENIVLYDGIEEALEKIDLLKNDDELCQRIAKSGQELVENRHTFEHRGKMLYDFIVPEINPAPPPSLIEKIRYLTILDRKLFFGYLTSK